MFKKVKLLAFMSFLILSSSLFFAADLKDDSTVALTTDEVVELTREEKAAEAKAKKEAEKKAAAEAKEKEKAEKKAAAEAKAKAKAEQKAAEEKAELEAKQAAAEAKAKEEAEKRAAEAKEKEEKAKAKEAKEKAAAEVKSKKVEVRYVDNVNSWQEDIDITEAKKKPGKYNIMITAVDLGGNTTIEGPHNIWIDPESDNPICNVTSPYPQMRVAGNLNIVGTALDDDGISKVVLILDKGKIDSKGNEIERTVTAEGKEFWSYYLDTNGLEEGPHTIEVIAYDINKEETKMSEPFKVEWQLDRQLPVTQANVKDIEGKVTSEMGVLVSGNVHFYGEVSDGNGIESLEYSVDGGELYSPIKLKKSKDKSKKEFDIAVNTKDFEDGPNVLWFRAKDLAGSVGLYSFLYFIDNTKPDVEIVSPEKGEVLNGKFTIAGYAKDKMGITELTWAFGDETGVIELVPGNPYWSVNLDTTSGKEKAQKFSITATDRAHNTVVVTQNIPLDQEADRPVVTLYEPTEEQVFTEKNYLYARGLVTDDDRVISVSVQLDNNDPIIQECNGVYNVPLLNPGELAAGNHKITIIATDVNGVQSHPFVTNFVSKVITPSIANPTIVGGKEGIAFVDGIEIHPEDGKSLSIPVNSPYGLKNAHYKVTWGKEGIIEEDIPLDGKKTDYTITIPVEPNSAKGVMNITVTATDTLERTSEFKSTYYVTNTTEIKSNENLIVFDDSRVSEDGVVISDERFPVSGYVLGERAASVELVPNTPFARAILVGNQIKIITTDKEGISAPITVKVTLDSGRVVKSNPITFKNETTKPSIKLNNYYDGDVLDGIDKDVFISGSADSILGIEDIGYRIIPVKTEIKSYVISTIKVDKLPNITWSTDMFMDEPSVEDPTLGSVPKPTFINNNGNFSLNIPMQAMGAPGVYVVEVVAKSKGGMLSSRAVAINTIPEVPFLETPEGQKPVKQPVAKEPTIVWIDGIDVYGVGVYQGHLDRVLKEFPRSEMNEGANKLSYTVNTNTETSITGEYVANKEPTLKANFANVDGQEYLSGMPIILDHGALKTGPIVQIFIDSVVPVSSVSYELSGKAIPGGDVTTKGAAKIIKPTGDNPTRWVAEIPLLNQPSRVTTINAEVKAGGLTQNIRGSVSIIRPKDNTLENDKKAISGFAGTGTVYDVNNKAYVLSNGSKYFYYANFCTPLTANVMANKPGLVAEVIGSNLIAVTATKEGYYDEVTVTVKDVFGDVYETTPINIVADSSIPVVNIAGPVMNDWVGNFITLSGTATDPIGVRKVEYSLDKGLSWKELPIENGDVAVTYSQEININSLPEGLITIDVRVTDNVGKVAKARSANYKDVTAPVVNVVQPLELDVINGTNLIVFDAKDNVSLNSVQYFAPMSDDDVVEPKPQNIEMNPLISTFVGIDGFPIDDKMAFEFTDMAGNKTRVGKWAFSIDNRSDLPISEIHVPDSMQVITRDFDISGVVYDDDGDVNIFYKIDDGEYRKVSKNEVYMQENPEAIYELSSSYSIHVPFETMTDNEHTVYVYAVDKNGVEGPVTQRTFRISTEEPKGAVLLPTIDQAVKGTVTISGNASDKNGIEKVQVSLDNGCSYNDAVGTENWKYVVDTRVIPGGTQVVFLKVWDKYGITGLYSSLINIDNDAPELKLELPLDDSTSNGSLFFSGYSIDNVGVEELTVKIRNLQGAMRPIEYELKIDNIIGESMDISNLPDGFYNVEVTSRDAADNVTNVSRNIHLKKEVAPAVVDVLYPLYGEHKAGEFTIYGQAEGESPIKQLKLYVDDTFNQETTLTSSGFYKFDLNSENLTEGVHMYRVDAVLEDGTKVSSREQQVTYSPYGPWITIDNFTYGDFAIERPKITGRAGYTISEEDKALLKDKKTPYQIKDEIEKRKIAKIEISFNNGKSFTEISKKGKWEYRVENQDLPAGEHFMLIKATMQNGEVAINRTIIQIDNEKPNIRLRAPSIGGRYNQTLNVSGLSSDDVMLKDVQVALRKGDKNAYGVPSFIQGLYLDFRMGGSALYQVGAGLTFFDDVVKVQASFGQLTKQQFRWLNNGRDADFRIGGNIIGFKILANVANIPFNFFFGHDFDWLSATVALGADFSWFSESGREGKGKIVSALVLQLEFPKVTFKKAKAFSSFSFYTEGSVWLFPSDIATTESQKVDSIIPKIAFGVRTNIF